MTIIESEENIIMQNSRISRDLKSSDLTTSKQLFSEKNGPTVSVPDLENAYRYCRRITVSHYENFPVASILIPRVLRKHISAIYAFARTADDFADEEQNRDKLLNWRRQLHACLEQSPSHPVFIALADTIRQFDLPIRWLDDLLTAFLLDLDKMRFESLTDLEHYCHFSANPVGRIVLWIFGYRSEELMEKSDAITTALQLTNFWQDISIDLKRDKIYIPMDLMDKYKIREDTILKQEVTGNFVPMMEFLIDYTNNLYARGLTLPSDVSGRLRMELRFTIAGGRKILQKVEKNKEKLLYYRPALTRADWIKLAFQMIKRDS